jgi:hypothetical protein
MGHWSHTCKLSHLPIINGTKVMLFLLKINENMHEYSEESLKKHGSTYMCTNEAVMGRFKPFMFPIRGEYDDYGGITNIVKDENTDMLESKFDLTIDEICAIVTSGRKNDGDDERLAKIIKSIDKNDDGDVVIYHEKYKPLVALSGMWVHGDFYDKLIASYSRDEVYDNIRIARTPVLKALGFEYVGEDKSGEKRCKFKFKKGNCIIYSDGGWGIENNIYSPQDLKEYCESVGEDLDISEFISKSKQQQLYDYVLPELQAKLEALEEGEAINKFIFMTGGGMQDYTDVLQMFDMGMSWYSYSELSVEYVHLAKNGLFRKHVHELGVFHSAMYCCGKNYDIVGASPQDGDYGGVAWVLNTATDIINNYIKENYV